MATFKCDVSFNLLGSQEGKEMSDEVKVKGEHERMDLYQELRPCPKEALKGFKKRGGFSGSSIDAQWRIRRLTEVFGPCGTGWGFTVTNRWSEEADGMKWAFVSGFVWYIDGDGEKRHAIEVTGGTDMAGAVDEAYKKSETDALGKSAASIGLAASVYEGSFDGDKYSSPSPVSAKGSGKAEPVSAQPAAVKSSGPKLPSAEVPDCYEIEVHFGKNKGSTLRDLVQSSDGVGWLRWYIKSKQEDPPTRQEDQRLFVAAMQVMENYDGEDVGKPKTVTIGGAELSEGDRDATSSEWANSEMDEFFS